MTIQRTSYSRCCFFRWAPIWQFGNFPEEDHGCAKQRETDPRSWIGADSVRVGMGACGSAHALSAARIGRAHSIRYERNVVHCHGRASTGSPEQCERPVGLCNAAGSLLGVAHGILRSCQLLVGWCTTEMLPIAAQQAGATGGALWQERGKV